jgi:3D (Asp-Asp-Asp) domain-containing protein
VITDNLIQHKDSKVYDTNDNLMTRQSNAQTTSLKGFDKVCDIYDVYDTTTQTASNVVDTFNPSVERVINVITSQEVTEDLSEQGVDVYDASIINDVINDDGCHTEDATNSTHETEAREPLKDGEKAKLRTPKPQVIRPGQRVKIKLKGSSRDGMTGVVREQKADVQGNVIVRLDDSPQLRQLMAKNPNSNLHCIEVSLSQLETMR